MVSQITNVSSVLDSNWMSDRNIRYWNVEIKWITYIYNEHIKVDDYTMGMTKHDNAIKWQHFPRYWPFVRGIHRSRWIPPQRSVTRSVNVFFDHRLNKRLSKQSWGSWFETTSRSVWRHCNAPLNVVMVCINGVNYAHKRLPNTNSSVYSKLCNGFLNQCIRKTRIDIYELTRYTNDIHKQGIHLKWLKI